MLPEKKQKIYKAISVALALLLWQAGATALDSGLLLASPWEVLVRLTTLWREPGFWSAVWFTFSRIVLGFLLAFVLGTGLGLLAGRWKGAELFLWPYMLTIKTVPVASFIILSLVFLKARQLSVFISFLMVLPVLYSNVLQGVKSTDKALLEMARVYRVPYG
ncbi:MAG: nitrate ABC transporter permease, partial [Clostridiales bacterium]|nr:nitrate ABC transporter permease [Clostridiales bacterium]